jgi:hypothetical protein
MAVLGSAEAREILQANGDADYEGYHDVVERLLHEVQALRRERRDESVYYAWIDVLTAVIETPQELRLPEVFRSAAWKRKELVTALASWTELRHDTILYVKQSYTPKLRSGPPVPSAPPPVYVEPYPDVFARAGHVVAQLRDRLKEHGVLPEALAAKYDDYITIMDELEQAARDELAGTPFSDEQTRSLRRIPARLKAITRLPAPLAEKLTGKADSEMALVADVHTNSNDEQVLEEAVGRPLLLSVAIPHAKGPTTFQGAMFSYYEFKQPMHDRLTDEAWQERLLDPEARPELPQWCPTSTASADLSI